MENQPAQTPQDQSQTESAVQGQAPESQKRRFHVPRVLFLIIALLLLLGLMEGGFYLYKNSQNNQSVTPTPVITKTPNPTTDPTASPSADTSDWKTYEATNYYEFKYPIEKFSVSSGQANISNVWPGEIIVRPNDSYIAESGWDQSSLYISAIENKNNLNLNQASKLLDSTVTIEPKEVIIDGLKGMRYDNLGSQFGYETQIYVITKGDNTYKNGLIYKFKVTNAPDYQDPKRPIAESILSTFKFTDSIAVVSPVPTGVNPSGIQVACTQEAKLCPDGVTYVGRSGPKCEFEKCPGN